jgi:hypothetical protein
MPASIADLFGNSVFVFWGAIVLICIVPTICNYWFKVRRHELDVELKHSLVERGMSADEIVRVLEAGRNPRDDKEEGGLEFVVESGDSPARPNAQKAPV